MTEIVVTNPASGLEVGRVPDQSGDVAAVVARLRRAQPQWEDLGVAARVKWLRLLADWMLDNEQKVAQLVHDDTGKVWSEAVLEVVACVDMINYISDLAAESLRTDRPSAHNPMLRVKRLSTSWRPYPVVGVITPWNFPLALSLFDSVPALAAGATVAVKPSEVTPLAVGEVVRAWREDIGAPAVFECITGGRAAGTALIDEVDFIQFTGSARTGRIVAQQAAGRMIPYGLELGGKDPAIVLADADIDLAARGIAFGGMATSGQMCTSVERVYVEAPVYDEFVEKLTEQVASLRQGTGRSPKDVDVSALATEAQLGIVAGHVEDAIAKGARVTTGGKAIGGLYFQPTVLVGVDHTMACMTEETFGPTLPVMKVADVDEAIRLANDSPYGLSASVWSKSAKRAEQVARRLDVGTVNINDSEINILCFPIPMAGWKQSGLGARNGGTYAIRKYCRPQAITAPQPLPGPASRVLANIGWFPYSETKTEILRRAMRLSGARDLKRRLGL